MVVNKEFDEIIINVDLDLEKEILKKVACNICHGMGYREIPGGDTIDCPVRSCENGYVKSRK